MHTVLPDRIETGTFAMAVAATGGDVVLEGTRLALLRTALEAPARTGLLVEERANGLRVCRNGGDIEPITIETQPFPGSRPTCRRNSWRSMTRPRARA